MKYDFNQLINRRDTSCAKWDDVEAVFGSEDILPMWVADMDFPIAKPITEALRKRTEHEIYGYTQTSPSVIEAVVNRMKRKYSWRIEPEWVVFTTGVVPVLHTAVRAFTHPGDEVIIQGPVYHPFWSAITANGCSVANNQLKLINRHYEIDFKDLESKFGSGAGGMMPSPRIKLMLLCHPHNPVGRVWTQEELSRVGEIIIKNDAIMVSDEIHGELLFRGFKHIPFAAISEEFEQNCLVCMAPSKTFNLAGLSTSSIIIPNKKIRDKFNTARAGIMSSPNIFGLVALEAAYRYGDEWLEQFLEYLQRNLEFLMRYFAERIPDIKVIKPEGTYLVWLDCRGLGMDTTSLRTFMREQAKVGLEDGDTFGPSGAGFQRMNIACPQTTLEEGLNRIEQAVKDAL
ncbi:MAG: MalY/PatB family protein [Dehalococcoidales bacterium]|jgi:cystathionine beta-lyase|nr:MalY/PatB family protein [Dehalococcoidales bacterium]MDP7109903.1 MalY/PatB family protein [Dehalococcoidales bacterium]MDP7309815.1 MalY/PatB family protein [Dehalococcoidales bacterium]MDP7409779.1 MalY/PatB family protein [Dehalococcoidales bacterium]MDP7676126.1 MalY/PatB family protein [Dehalococcoidales bacterium]|tara:strand:- start:4917 stop:6116 length:1200 start_codon:yes stop_codon:yes gene_type:complete